MGRKKANGKAARRREIADALIHHGVEQSFAMDVAGTFVEKGSDNAIVHLYCGGYEVVHENGKVDIVRSVRGFGNHGKKKKTKRLQR